MPERTPPRTKPAVEVGFASVDPRGADAVASMQRYFAELDQRFPGGFDPGDALTAEAPVFDPPTGVFVVAHARTRPVACGGVQRFTDEVAEIKRMWVDPAYRGRGLGRGMLAQLERRAAGIGYCAVHLDTNSVLTEAIALYVSAGYVEIERYNDNPYARHFFGKRL